MANMRTPEDAQPVCMVGVLPAIVPCHACGCADLAVLTWHISTSHSGGVMLSVDADLAHHLITLWASC